MEVFKVVEPGPLATVQDRGRFGYQRFGVPVSGALDKFSSRIANLLVGNPESAAVLEVTLMRLKLEVVSEADVAVCGAEIPVSVNGEPRENWTSFRVEPGDLISLKQAKRGLRAYLAVTGGIDMPVVMGSRFDLCGRPAGRTRRAGLGQGRLDPAAGRTSTRLVTGTTFELQTHP